MNILVIDDHPLYRSGVAMHLQAADPDLQVTEFASLDAALASVDEGRAVDLMLLDLKMPGYQGLESLERVRRSRPEIPVLVLSQEEQPETVRRCIELGAYGFLPKSAPASTLYPALKLVLSGGVFLPASSLSVAAASAGPANRDAWSRLGARLTERQRQVLLRIVQGKPNKIIARELGLSDGTVKTHVANIFNALVVGNRTEAVYALARAGLSIHDLE